MRVVKQRVGRFFQTASTWTDVNGTIHIEKPISVHEDTHTEGFCGAHRVPPGEEPPPKSHACEECCSHAREDGFVIYKDVTNEFTRTKAFRELKRV